jgi:hypothetical protein
MILTIKQYIISTNRMEIEVPKTSYFLEGSMQIENDMPTLFFICNTKKGETKKIKFKIITNGEIFDEKYLINWRYIITTNVNGNYLHYFMQGDTV